MIANFHSMKFTMLIIALLGIIGICFEFTQIAHAQQQEYYDDYGDEPQIQEYDQYGDEAQMPDYEQPEEYGDSYIEDPQNPDPQFVDEVEPGEYNQSDDVTEPDLSY